VAREISDYLQNLGKKDDATVQRGVQLVFMLVTPHSTQSNIVFVAFH
jgi:hypothetical protein